MLIFPAYIKKMQGSRSKFPSKNLIRQRCAEGFNSGVKGLMEQKLLFVPLDVYMKRDAPTLPVSV
jgi:hypothetical protein